MPPREFAEAFSNRQSPRRNGQPAAPPGTSGEGPHIRAAADEAEGSLRRHRLCGGCVGQRHARGRSNPTGGRHDSTSKKREHVTRPAACETAVKVR